MFMGDSCITGIRNRKCTALRENFYKILNILYGFIQTNMKEKINTRLNSDIIKPKTHLVIFSNSFGLSSKRTRDNENSPFSFRNY